MQLFKDGDKNEGLGEIKLVSSKVVNNSAPGRSDQRCREGKPDSRTPPITCVYWFLPSSVRLFISILGCAPCDGELNAVDNECFTRSLGVCWPSSFPVVNVEPSHLLSDMWSESEEKAIL